ncbi:MAG: histidine-type phosphatase [Prevotella sp.]|nr:histidine-type phosphatase [Prevotella sp.]
MRKVILIAFVAIISSGIWAQNVLEDMKANTDKVASNYCAYPEPTEPLTPAPKGKKPFYISHYGRHGSRYLIHFREYNYPFATLQMADRQGKLSERGKKVFQEIGLLREEAKGRLGELTPLGAEQHRKIANRMYRRFPEVFKGDVCVDAKSTTVIRCVLSMENALQELASLNPKLRITSDASGHDMYYMNFQDIPLSKKRWSNEANAAYDAYCLKHAQYEQPLLRLFNDTAYARNNIHLFRLNTEILKIASSVQGTKYAKQFSLFEDIYTIDELYENWLQGNAYWYISFGPSPLNNGTQPFSQRNLLRKIIAEADSCIALPRPGATLRFGHETIVLPLTCLLGLNGFDQQEPDLEALEGRGWINYKVFPMACNLQFIFYRKNPQDDDVLVKILLNENETTLPIASDCAPYYHWKDFRDFYLKKLADYKE